MTGPFGGALAAAPNGDGKLFLIGLEEHFATRELQRLNAGTDKRLFSGGGRRPELLDLGAGRIMFLVDYPMASARAGTDWFRAVDLPRATKEKIAHQNAERLLRIGAA